MHELREARNAQFVTNVEPHPDGGYGVCVNIYDDFGPDEPLSLVKSVVLPIDQAEGFSRGILNQIDEAKQRNRPS